MSSVCLSPLAPYACHVADERGRLFDEPKSKTRSDFQRDRDRIVHSTAFRRLEYKTQVFVNHVGDHYRTRLTHSLEVAQLARSLARALSLNEDLAESLGLAHDLGHPPFGHAGEDALIEAMKPYGGFDHNAQTIRLLTKLERRYADFDGLNLTWDTLEGVAKHNGPIKDAPRALAEFNAKFDLELGTHASAEAQVAALADDIAYFNHDLDDGLRAGLFSQEDLFELPMVGAIFKGVMEQYPHIEMKRQVHESIRRVMDEMVMNLLNESKALLKDSGVASVADVRAAGRPLIRFTDDMFRDVLKPLRAFMFERMYRHYEVNRMTSKARRLVTELFGFYMAEPNCLPTRWQELAGAGDKAHQAVVVTDFIAGMTDRFAMQEHQKLFDLGSLSA